MELLQSTLTHDIRNILNLSCGHSELLKEKVEPGYEMSEKDIERMEKVSKGLESIKDNLEDIKALKNLKSKQEYQKINIKNVLSDNIDTLEPIANEEEIEIKTDYKDVENPYVITTPLVERATYNIIDNSITHGKDYVKVQVNEYEDYIEAVIEDNGEGIDDKVLERMFPEEQKEIENYPSTGSFIIHETVKDTNIELEYQNNNGAHYTLEMPLAETFQ